MSEKGGNSVSSEKPKKSATSTTKRSIKGVISSRTTSTKSNGAAKTDTEKRLEGGVEKPKKTTTDSLKKPNRDPLSVEQRSKSETSKRTTSSFSSLSRRPPPVDKAPTPRERLSGRARPSVLGKSRSAQTPSPKRSSTEKKAEEEPLAVTPRTQSDLTMHRRPRRSDDCPIEKSPSSRSASRCSTPLVPRPSVGSRSSSRNSTPSTTSKSRELKPSMREQLWLTSPRTQSSTPRKEPTNYVKSGSFTQRPRSPKETKPARRLSVPPRNTSRIKRESVSPGPTTHSSPSHTGHKNLVNKKPIRSNSSKSSRTLDDKGRKLSVESSQPTEDGKSSELEAPVISYSLDDSQSGTGATLGRTVSRNSTPSPIPMSRPSLASSTNDLEAGDQFDTMTEEQERLMRSKQRIPSPDLEQVHLMPNNTTSEAPVDEDLEQPERIVLTNEGLKEESEQQPETVVSAELQDQIKSVIEETSKDDHQKQEVEVKDLVIKVEKKTDVGSQEEEDEQHLELPTSPFAKHICEDILANVALDAETSDIKLDALVELHKTPSSSPKAKQSESPVEPIITEDQSKDENKEQPETKVKTADENEGPPVEAYLNELVLKMQDDAYSPKGAITSRWLMDQASDTFYSRSWSGMDKVEDPCFDKEDTVPIPEQSNNRVSIEDFIKPESFTKKNKDIIAVEDPVTFDPKPKSFSKQKTISPRVADPDDDDFKSVPKKKRNFVSRCAVCIFGGLAVTFFFIRNRAKSVPTN